MYKLGWLVHPTLAHHGLTLANAAIQTLLFGLAGTVNVVKGEIINRGIDKLAGEEINKGINQLIDSASWGFKQGLPGLTEEEARTLGSASAMLGIGITQGTTAIKSIIKDIGKPHIVHKKVELDEHKKAKSKMEDTGGNRKKEDINRVIDNEYLEKGYNEAVAGKKNKGQYESFLKQTPQQLHKSIRSYEKNIIEHEMYIANPKSHVPNWDSLSELHKNNLIHHWKKDIIRAKEYKYIAEKVLNGK